MNTDSFHLTEIGLGHTKRFLFNKVNHFKSFGLKNVVWTLEDPTSKLSYEQVNDHVVLFLKDEVVNITVKNGVGFVNGNETGPVPQHVLEWAKSRS